MIHGGGRRPNRRTALRTVVERRLQRIADELQLQLDPHAIDAQYVHKLEEIAQARADRALAEEASREGQRLNEFRGAQR
jgi:hypothetical protein